MSKKNKAKFKKQIKAQIQQEMNASLKNTALNITNKEKTLQNESATRKEILSEKNNNLSQIKYDLKKTGVIVGLFALIILGVYFTNQKINILTPAGDWLFKFFHIN